MRKGIETVIQVVRTELREEGQVTCPVSRILTAEHVAAVAVQLIGHRAQECLMACALDTAARPLAVGVINIGGIDRTDVDLAPLFRFLLTANARRFWIAHNHPSGGLSVSDKDREATSDVAIMAGLLGLDFLDHVIVTPQGGHVSIREHEPDGFAPWKRDRAPAAAETR